MLLHSVSDLFNYWIQFPATKPGFFSLLCEIRNALVICNGPLTVMQSFKKKKKSVTGIENVRMCLVFVASLLFIIAECFLQSRSAAAELIISEQTTKKKRVTEMCHYIQRESNNSPRTRHFNQLFI